VIKNRKSNGQTAISHLMHYKASVWHQTDCVITAQGEKRRATERTRAVPVPSPRPVRPCPPLSLSVKRFVTDACDRSHSD